MLKVYGVTMLVPYLGSYETVGYYTTEEEAEDRGESLIRDDYMIFSVVANDADELAAMLNSALEKQPPATYT